MKTNGLKFAASILIGLYSVPSVARVVTDVPDNTRQCLSQIGWSSEAFRSLEGNHEVYVKAESFDRLVDCAYSESVFRGGFQLSPAGPGADGAELLKVEALKEKYPAFSDLIGKSVIPPRPSRVITDLQLGEDAGQYPTAFVHAQYYEGNSVLRPVERVIYRTISYTRVPAYPGFCDDLKDNVERYEWCTGARGPGPQDPRLTACSDQLCDFNVDGTKR